MNAGKLLSKQAAEIQNIIFSHPAFLDAAVIGAHSAKQQGNILYAFVVPAPNAPLSDVDIRELKKLAGDHEK